MQQGRRSRFVLICMVGIGILGCSYIDTIRYSEETASARQFFNRDVQYWLDPVRSIDGEDHQIIYYKNSRPAAIRKFDAAGRLNRVSYLDREGQVFRFDSLVYQNDRLVAGHYYLEPGRIPVLHFYNHFKGRRLESRRWWSDADTVYSVERFLFDRKGYKIMYVVLDSQEDILLVETYHPENNQRHLRNVYQRDSLLVEQTVFISDRPARIFHFDRSGRIVEIERMGSENRAIIRSRLNYDALGQLSSEQLISSRGEEIALLPSAVLHSIAPSIWKHPSQPAAMPSVLVYDYPDPVVSDPYFNDADSGYTLQDHRLRSSAQLVLRHVYGPDGSRHSDSLYRSGPVSRAGTVIHYDSLGYVRQWSVLDQQGQSLERLHYFRDDQQRIIREELHQAPDRYAGAVTRFYDGMGNPYLSEMIGENGEYLSSHRFFEGGGIKIDYRVDRQGVRQEKLVTRLGGDTLQHLLYDQVAYFWIESAIDPLGTVLYQRRYTENGLFNWQVHFDSLGRPTKEEHRKMNGTLFKGIRYDSAKRTWTSLLISPDGEITGEEMHKLDSLGKEIQVIASDVNGDKSWERRYAYRGGRLLKSAQMDADSKPMQISDYRYNEQGQLIEEEARSMDDSTLYTITYRYDVKGNPILETYRSNIDNIVSSRRFYFDELGRESREEIIEGHQLREVIQYSYYPDFRLRIAEYYDLEGELLRQEVQNDYGENVFAEFEFNLEQ